MTLIERLRKIARRKPSADDNTCLTRACFKDMHYLCSGIATFGWLPSKPCTCECHKD